MSEEPVFTQVLENRPGMMAELAERLAQARINVKYAYATTATQSGAMVVLSVSNVDKAAALLGY